MFTFNHVNFNVLDLERSLRFYREALGLEPARRVKAPDGSFELCFLSDGVTDYRLELTWLADHKEPYDLGEVEFHLAFAVPDMEAAHAKHAEMGCICFENTAMGIYFIEDPDGYWLEVIPARDGVSAGLDAAIMQRQTVRAFSDKAPEKEKLCAMIEAGRLAPFAGLVQRDCDTFRRFFVVSRDSALMPKLQALVQQGRREEAERMAREGLDKRFPESAATLRALGAQPATDLLAAPYLIVVAERGGVPQREKVVLGYVLENMWLKATELGLALKVCSGVSDIADTASLKALFGLDENEIYAFDAVSVGYPKQEIPVRTAERKPQPDVTFFD